MNPPISKISRVVNHHYKSILQYFDHSPEEMDTAKLPLPLGKPQIYFLYLWDRIVQQVDFVSVPVCTVPLSRSVYSVAWKSATLQLSSFPGMELMIPLHSLSS